MLHWFPEEKMFISVFPPFLCSGVHQDKSSTKSSKACSVQLLPQLPSVAGEMRNLLFRYIYNSSVLLYDRNIIKLKII
jgi:hypothetical protein